MKEREERERGEGGERGRGERGSTLVSLFFNKRRMTLNTSLEEVVKLNKWILSLCPSVLHRIITVLASNLSLVISLIWILIFKLSQYLQTLIFHKQMGNRKRRGFGGRGGGKRRIKPINLNAGENNDGKGRGKGREEGGRKRKGREREGEEEGGARKGEEGRKEGGIGKGGKEKEAKEREGKGVGEGKGSRRARKGEGGRKGDGRWKRKGKKEEGKREEHTAKVVVLGLVGLREVKEMKVLQILIEPGEVNRRRSEDNVQE